MAETTSEALQDLHINCVRALRSYMAGANKTCKVLSDITSFPVPTDKRLQILEQRRAENAAAQNYQQARQNLFAAANWQ